MNHIKLPLIAALVCLTTVASAEPKAPKRPSVYHADVCQQVALKGALGFSDTDSKPIKDVAMVCQTKSSARILREWRLEGWGDGDMFVLGR